MQLNVKYIIKKEVGNQIMYSVETLYKRKFPLENLQGYYTTLPIYPYSYKSKYIYVGIKEEIPEQLLSILHELNHFMFHLYFGHLQEELRHSKFHLIKESLTFFTNPEDPGLKNQKDLRELCASKYWESIDEVIEAARRKVKSN